MMTSPSFRNDKGAEQEDAKTLKMMYHALVLPGSGESMASIALEEIARDIPGALCIQHHLDCIHKTFFGDEPVKAKKENTIDESSIIIIAFVHIATCLSNIAAPTVHCHGHLKKQAYSPCSYSSSARSM